MASFDRDPSICFKSNFARSLAMMAVEKKPSDVSSDDGSPSPSSLEKPQVLVKPSPRRSVPAIPTYQSIRESYRRPKNDAVKFWKMKQEGVKSDTNGSTLPTTDESKDDEILRLRKECQSLMEANRKLQQQTISSSSIDVSLLQSQVDTLQWQLKQADSSRQMYRAVMEQVAKYLERVHKSVELCASPRSATTSRTKHRSRSVHTVASGGGGSRASSPSTVHRANSIAQIQDSYCIWRGSRGGDVVSLEKLSQEAFRLLRTVQSLLNTREPDLARVSDLMSERRDSTSMGSCSSIAQGSVCQESKQSPATPQLSVGSTEDESGFSSMSSFHENGQSDHKEVASEVARQRSGSFQVDSQTASHSLRHTSSQPSDDSNSRNTKSASFQGDTKLTNCRPGSLLTVDVCHTRTTRSGSFQVDSHNMPPISLLTEDTPTRNTRSGSFQATEPTHRHNPSFQVDILQPQNRSLKRDTLQSEAHSPFPESRSLRSGSFQMDHSSESQHISNSGSFQPTDAFPPPSNQRSFHELGLPLVDSSYRHRRWSSTPVENGDSLRVLWV